MRRSGVRLFSPAPAFLHEGQRFRRASGADFQDRLELASNTGMNSPYEIEQRLVDLEIKTTFTEDLVDHLNHRIVQQQEQLDLLMREIAQLRQQAPANDPTEIRSARDELPPHY
jgi:SlyX protein